MKTDHKFRIFLLSDSSGNLLEHLFNAVLTQFHREQFEVKTLPFIKDKEQLEKATKQIHGGIVFHAFVSGDLKKQITGECEKRKIPVWDVTGSTVEFLEKTTGTRAASDPHLLHSTSDAAYRGRVEALEFALQHDDNRRIDELEKADIILVGVSRVSKSPNALFLAYRGFRVANISIVPSQGLPEPLARHTRKNVVALTLQPKQLAEIRKRRFEKWKLESFDYEELQSVVREVMDAEKIYRQKGWPVIDTTELAVEETSALVLAQLQLKPKVFE